MEHTFEELILIAQQIRDNELPESNTAALIGGLFEALTAKVAAIKVEVADGSITTKKLADEAVTEDKLSTGVRNKLDILYKLSVKLSGGGNKKRGTSVNVTLSWTITVNDESVDPTSQSINGITLDVSARSYTFMGVTADTTYTLVVDGVTATQSVRFFNPAYFGVVDPSYTVGNSTAGLTELTNYGVRAYNKAITSSGSKKAVYMYPSALGNLTSIKDGNNFDFTGSFTKETGLTINGESYVAYILTKEANLNNVTFKFT